MPLLSKELVVLQLSDIEHLGCHSLWEIHVLQYRICSRRGARAIVTPICSRRDARAICSRRGSQGRRGARAVVTVPSDSEDLDHDHHLRVLPLKGTMSVRVLHIPRERGHDLIAHRPHLLPHGGRNNEFEAARRKPFQSVEDPGDGGDEKRCPQPHNNRRAPIYNVDSSRAPDTSLNKNKSLSAARETNARCHG